MKADKLRCKECGTDYPLEALFVCDRCFGPLEVHYSHDAELDVPGLRRRIQGGPQNVWRYADFLPLVGGPPGPSNRLASRAGLPAGCTPLIRADRLAERLGLREVWVKNDAANPTHSFKDRVVAVAAARAKELGYEVLACASTGNLANAVAAQAAALGLRSYVFIPSNLEEQKIIATGVYGTNLVSVRGNYDDVNRLCTELSADRDWAFVNVNMRPYYAEGSKTLAYEIAEQLGWQIPDRIVAPIASGSLYTKIATRLPGVDRHRPRRRAPARHERSPGDRMRAGRERLRGRSGVLPAGQAGHDRQVARDRQPGRRPVRPRAREADGRTDRLGVRPRRSGRRSACSPRRRASSPRPRAASRRRSSANWLSGAISTPTSGSSS